MARSLLPWVALLVCLCATPLAVVAVDPVYWVDWTSSDYATGDASGVILVDLPGGGTQTVHVTLTSRTNDNLALPVPFVGAQLSCTDAPGQNTGSDPDYSLGAPRPYWQPDAPYISATVPNPPPPCDIIRLDGTLTPNTRYTLRLEDAAGSPVFVTDALHAIISLGQPGGEGADIAINRYANPFTVLPTTDPTPGYFGGSTDDFSMVTYYNPPAYELIGHEGHGVVELQGEYSEFSWTVPDGEYWHGFTFGIRSTLARTGQCPVQVPLPVAGARVTSQTDGRNVGSVSTIELDCAPGTTSQPTYSRCKRDCATQQPYWTTPGTPTCAAPLTCGPPPPPPAGTQVTQPSDGTNVGSVVTYQRVCLPGFTSPSVSTTCTACRSGSPSWTPANIVVPPCRPVCTRIRAPAHGYLVARLDGNQIHYTFKCDTGYRLSSPYDTFKCHVPTGQITCGRQARPYPTCVRIVNTTGRRP